VISPSSITRDGSITRPLRRVKHVTGVNIP
jgi:hypothetical protein